MKNRITEYIENPISDSDSTAAEQEAFEPINEEVDSTDDTDIDDKIAELETEMNFSKIEDTETQETTQNNNTEELSEERNLYSDLDNILLEGKDVNTEIDPTNELDSLSEEVSDEEDDERSKYAELDNILTNTEIKKPEVNSDAFDDDFDSVKEPEDENKVTNIADAKKKKENESEGVKQSIKSRT